MRARRGHAANSRGDGGERGREKDGQEAAKNAVFI